ncbi:MAG: hypothetical protein U0269_06735 [Polyangiales bacterium]
MKWRWVAGVLWFASTGCKALGAVVVVPSEARDGASDGGDVSAPRDVQAERDASGVDAIDPDALAALDVASDSFVAARDATVDAQDASADAGMDAAPRRQTIRIVGEYQIFNYAAANFRAWMGRRGALTIDVAPSRIDSAYLAGIDVLVVGDLGRSLELAESEALFHWVTGVSRGRLLVIGGYRTAQWSETDSVLRPFGMATTPTVLEVPRTEFDPAAVSRGASVAPPAVNGTFVLTAMDAHSAPELFALVPGRPVIAARYENNGKMFVSLDEWSSLDVSFGAPESEQFWTNVFDYLQR